MPRRPRITLPCVPHHVIQRGNNRQPCFFAEDNYRFYLQWLRKYAEKTDCIVDEIRKATNGNYALGNECFKKGAENMLARRVVPGKPGRPRKNRDS
ncbi:MAG: hypothetical protein DIZ77_14900 [endosymbiont of Seepiophila jonesi]|uniref:Transposase n=1 Tax=endosymbiont of Lamellibrachia luymesi TaxID=2200907 RepID=A0A370E119_9GAMM|nr:MAG: hypothetical protein DIZ77_14900 [endosymbiont of Seepiophila jonesi]RDH92457.1 MAG: hypothetical protein DIZ79_03380 [endosymbiont of Lamellibrachia luymesi]